MVRVGVGGVWRGFFLSPGLFVGVRRATDLFCEDVDPVLDGVGEADTNAGENGRVKITASDDAASLETVPCPSIVSGNNGRFVGLVPWADVVATGLVAVVHGAAC